MIHICSVSWACSDNYLSVQCGFLDVKFACFFTDSEHVICTLWLFTDDPVVELWINRSWLVIIFTLNLQYKGSCNRLDQAKIILAELISWASKKKKHTSCVEEGMAYFTWIRQTGGGHYLNVCWWPELWQWEKTLRQTNLWFFNKIQKRKTF